MLKELDMKGILLVSVLGLVGVAPGQDAITFTDKLVTFTNLQGQVYRDVRLVRADADGITYREGVGGGRVRYTDLAPGVLGSLGLDTNRIAVAKARGDFRPAADATGRQSLQQQARKAAAAVGSDSSPPLIHAGQTSFRSDPLRAYQGRVYDFSQAIKWFESAPPQNCPYPRDSALYKDWEGRMHAYETSSWQRYLLKGQLLETRAEGHIVSVRVTVNVESFVGVRVAGGLQYIPRYTPTETTKQVLLMHAPEGGIRLPIFAIPAGNTLLPGATRIEAFDYGKPIGEAR